MNFERKFTLFINSFIRFCESDGEKYEEIVLKRSRPELDENYGRVMNILESAAIGGDIAALAHGIPIPIGSVIALPIKSITKYAGRRVAAMAAEKINDIINFSQDDERIVRLILHEAIREIAIAFEYQLDRLEGKKDVLLLASSASKRLMSFLQTKPENWNLDVEGVIEGILTGFSSKQMLDTNIDTFLQEHTSMPSQLKSVLHIHNAKHWNSDSVFTRVGLERGGKYYKTEHSSSIVSRADKYGYRKTLITSLESAYASEEPPTDIFTKHHTPHMILVPYSDLAEYAAKHRDINSAEAKGSFNEYIAAKYIASHHEIQAICRSDPQPNDSLNLSYADLRGSDFRAMNFEGVDLSYANLDGAFLAQTNFKRANLEHATGRDTYLVRVNLVEAKLANADFDGADFTCACLDNLQSIENCNLLHTKLEGMSFQNTDLQLAQMDSNIRKVLAKIHERLAEDRQRFQAIEIMQKQLMDQNVVLEKRLDKIEEKELDTDDGYPAILQTYSSIDHYYPGDRISHLEQSFLQKSKVLLLGIAGSGKTQLSRYYAKSHYSDSLVHAFAASSSSELEKSYYDVALQLLGKKSLGNKTTKAIKKLLLDYLKNEHGSLLIFDNVDDDEVKQQLYHDMLYIDSAFEKEKNHQILVTSQDSNVFMGNGFSTLHISGWSESEAVFFLTAHTQAVTNAEEARKLAEIFDYLPLGIDAARLYLQDKQISVVNYLDRIEDEKSRMMVEEGEAELMEKFYIKPEAYRTQKAAIRVAIKATADIDNNALELLRFCSFISAEKIPFTLLTKYMERLQPGLSKNEIEISIENSLKVLKKSSLILNENGQDNERTLDFHRIVQKSSVELLSTEQKDYYTATIADLLVNHFTRDNTNQEKLNNNRLFLPHVERFLELAKKYSLTTKPAIVSLIVARGTYYDFNGDHLHAKIILMEVKNDLEALAEEAILAGDENEATLVTTLEELCQKLATNDKALPTLYGQTLYHLGKSQLSLWQAKKTITSDNNDYQAFAKMSFEQAVYIRNIIDESGGLYDDRFNAGDPRPMDSTIFQRQGVLLWHKLQDSEEALQYALAGYRILIEEEISFSPEFKDSINLDTCRRLSAECTKSILIQKESADITKYIEIIEDYSSNLEIELIGDKADLQYREVLAENLYKALEGKVKEYPRIGREYNLISEIFLYIHTISHRKEDRVYVEKFATKAKTIENNRQGFILDDANQLLKQVVINVIKHNIDSPILEPETLEIENLRFDKLISAFVKLGELYIDQGNVPTLSSQEKMVRYIDATKFLNYAISISKERGITDGILSEKIEYINQALIATTEGIIPVTKTANENSKIDKFELMILRDFAKSKVAQIEALSDIDKITATKELFEIIAQRMQNFLARLYQESEATLGTPPCSYSIIGLGSMALKTITPYSDLEFAILTANNNYKNDIKTKDYFIKLTQLVHFRVINLGETVIAKSQMGGLTTDHLILNGVSFDLGGKTPIGRTDKNYELIQTIDEMMNYLRNEGDKIERLDKNLPSILEICTHVHGDNLITEAYQRESDKFLQSTNSKGELHHQQRALIKLQGSVLEVDYNKPDSSSDTLIGDIGKFDMVTNVRISEGKLFDAKKEIYRLPDRLVYGLGLYNGIRESAWQVIDQLNDQEIINDEAKHNIKYAISYATLLRLKVYQHYNAKNDLMSFFDDDNDSIKFHFSENEMQLEGELFKFYYTMLALHLRIKHMCEIKEHDIVNSVLRAIPLYDDSKYNIGVIYTRLFRYEEAQVYLEELLNELISEQDHSLLTTDILQLLGASSAHLGEYDKALGYRVQGLELIQKILPNDDLVIAKSLSEVGGSYHDLCSVEDEYFYQEKALEIINRYPNLNSLDNARILYNIGNSYAASGQYREALDYQLRALKIFKAKLSEEHTDISSILSSIGNRYSQLGEFQNALSYHEQALRLRQNSLPSEHPDIATSLSDISDDYMSLGKYNTALRFSLQSAVLRQKILPAGHLDIALSMNSIGSQYMRLGDYPKALEYQQRGIDIVELTSTEHQYLAYFLHNIAQTYDYIEEYQTALEKRQQALEIMREVLPSEHPNFVAIYIGLSSSYERFEQYEQMVESAFNAMAITSKSESQYHLKAGENFINAIRQYCVSKEIESVDNVLMILHLGMSENPTISTAEVLIDTLQRYEVSSYNIRGRNHYINALINKGAEGSTAYEEEIKQAELMFGKSISTREESGSFADYANFLYQITQYDKAKENLQRAIDLYKQGNSIIYGVEQRDILNKDLQKEVDFYSMIDIDVATFAYFMLIDVQIKLNNIEQANKLIAVFRLNTEDNPTSLAYSLLGYSYQQLEKVAEAAEAFGQAVALYQETEDQPEYTLAQENLKECLRIISSTTIIQAEDIISTNVAVLPSLLFEVKEDSLRSTQSKTPSIVEKDTEVNQIIDLETEQDSYIKLVEAVKSDGVSMAIIKVASLDNNFYITSNAVVENIPLLTNNINIQLTDQEEFFVDDAGSALTVKEATEIPKNDKDKLQTLTMASFAAKEMIESTPMLKYFVTEILPIQRIQHLVPQTLQEIKWPSLLSCNYIWIGMHCAAGVMGSFTLLTIDVDITKKIIAPLISTAAYGFKLMAYDYLAEQKQLDLQNRDNKPIGTPYEFMEKCGIDITTYTMINFVNGGVNKMMFGMPLTAIAYDMIMGVTFSGMQCYDAYNQAIAPLQTSFINNIVSGIADIAVGYIAYNNMNFDLTNSIGQMVAIKQGMDVIGSIVITDQMTKIVLHANQEMINDIETEYLTPVVDYVSEKIANISGDCYLYFMGNRENGDEF